MNIKYKESCWNNNGSFMHQWAINYQNTVLISSDFIVHVFMCFFLDCSGQTDIVDCPGD